jgi:uncharacterized Ntn-hydrolase superfamily protein
MTFSIVARCSRTGNLGVGTASKALAAGGIVPYVKSGVGAIASQSFANPYIGIDGLELLSQGLPAQRALDRLIEGDAGREVRQVGIVDKEGRTAAYTGERCIAYAGDHAGAGFVCLGNILAGEAVWEAMAESFAVNADEELPLRLLLALEAGEEVGGDRRGRQSAGIRVVANEEYPFCDLRVDDHDDPIQELRRVYEVWEREGEPFIRLTPTRADFTPEWDLAMRLKEQIETELDEQEMVKESTW